MYTFEKVGEYFVIYKDGKVFCRVSAKVNTEEAVKRQFGIA